MRHGSNLNQIAVGHLRLQIINRQYTDDSNQTRLRFPREKGPVLAAVDQAQSARPQITHSGGVLSDPDRAFCEVELHFRAIVVRAWAIGVRAIAIGMRAFAFGVRAFAPGVRALAIGVRLLAIGTRLIDFGHGIMRSRASRSPKGAS